MATSTLKGTGLRIKSWTDYGASSSVLASQATQTITVSLPELPSGCERKIIVKGCSWGTVYQTDIDGDTLKIGVINLGTSQHTVTAYVSVVEIYKGG